MAAQPLLHFRHGTLFFPNYWS